MTAKSARSSSPIIAVKAPAFRLFIGVSMVPSMQLATAANDIEPIGGYPQDWPYALR